MTDKLNEIFELPKKDAKKSQEDVFDNTFSKKCNDTESIPKGKKTKKELQKELDKEKEDFVKSIQNLITSKMPIEPPKRKYERNKPSKEKSIDDEYKEKLRRNLEIARSKRHLLKKGVSPKTDETPKSTEESFDNTFVKSVEEPVIKTEEEKVIEKPVEKLIEKVVHKVIEKPIEKPVEKVIDKVVHKVVEKVKSVEKPIEKVVEKPIEKSFDNTFVKSVVKEEERYSTYNKPIWFKKPSWMK